MIVSGMASGDDHFEEGSRFEECVRVHNETVEKVSERRPDFFLDPGDLYEKASTPTERLAVASYGKGIADECPLIVARGNHDRMRELLLLQKLQTRHPIRVIETTDAIAVAGALVAVVAWPSMASDLDEEGSREALRNVLRGLGAHLRSWPGPRILMGHLQVDQAVTGAGQPLIGRGLSVSLADLDLACADLVVLSHIHRAQHWTTGHGDVVYCGSQHRVDYGELEEKSILSFRIEVTEMRRHVTWERLPTSARPMLHVSGAWLPEELGLAVDLAPDADVSRADIRLRYTVPSDRREPARAEADALKADWLKRGAASVKVEPETDVTTRARAPEVSLARTLTEKVEAYWRATNNVPDPPRAARLKRCIAQLEGGT